MEEKVEGKAVILGKTQTIICHFALDILTRTCSKLCELIFFIIILLAKVLNRLILKKVTGMEAIFHTVIIYDKQQATIIQWR